MRLLKWVGILLVAFVVMGVVGNALGGGSDTDTAVPKPSASTSEPEATEDAEVEDPEDTDDSDHGEDTDDTEDTDEDEGGASGPLWKKADGKQSFTCWESGSTVEFGLPAASPVTKELNALLKAAEGRKPMTVLTIKVDEQVDVEVEGNPIFRELVLTTPKGSEVVGPSGDAPDVQHMLMVSGLTGDAFAIKSKTLRARGAKLEERVERDNENGIFYYVFEKPLTQVDYARASFHPDDDSACWRDD